MADFVLIKVAHFYLFIYFNAAMSLVPELPTLVKRLYFEIEALYITILGNSGYMCMLAYA